MTNNYNQFSHSRDRNVGWLRLLLLFFTFGMLTIRADAQTTVTITCTGSLGSFNSGSVNAAGVKNDGNMVTINSSANRGWAHFDLSSIPPAATVTAVTANFTTYTSTLSTAANNIYGFTGNPASIAGATLYTNCGSGTSFNATSWTANALQTKAFNAAGIAFIQANLGTNNANIGYVRGSTNTYNIYGYNGVTPPNLVITYNLPLASDLLLQAPATPSGTICNGAGSTVSVTLKNNGTSPVDFSVNPATINVSVSGPNPTSFAPVTISTGTLAPNATQVVNIASGYDASLSGTYNFTSSVTWAPDLNVANNSLAWSGTSSFPVTGSSNVYTFCDGTLPQLNTVVTLPATPGPTGDDAVQTNVSIPFPFLFHGVSQSILNIYTNGFIQFGTSSGSTTTYGATIPNAAAPNNIVALAWDDWNVVAPTGTISYFTTGTTPNRKFVINYTNVYFYNSPALGITGQIVLNESDNSIDIFLTNVNNGGTESAVCGVENATGTAGTVAPGRQYAIWSPTSLTNEAWKFSWTGSAYTVASIPHAPVTQTPAYTWTPAAGLSDPTIANPVATVPATTTQIYTVSVTYNGCTVSDTVSLTNLGAGDPAPTTTGASVCAGVSATLSANGLSTLRWYSAPIGGTLVNTGPTYTSTFAATATFYVESYNGVCPSPRTPVTVVVTAQPSLNPSATPTTLCLGESSQLAANNFISGNLLTTTAGGNGASANIFTISNVNGNSPIRIDSVSMGITAGTLAEVWYIPGAYTCGVTPSSSAGWTLAGQVAITPAGVAPALTMIPLFVNATIPVGQVYSFVVATNGSNYYTNGTTECAVAYSDANISVSQGRGGTAFGGAFTGLVNSPRVFNGRIYYSFGDPNLTFNWSQSLGSGSISNPSIANPVVTPSTSGTNTYSVLATNVAGCTTQASVNVTANPLPNDAVIDSVTNVFCGCGIANIFATATSAGSTIRWYDAPVGGTLLGTTASNAAFATPYACGSVTYYAESWDATSGCIQAGARASVTVTPIVASPVSASASVTLICDGTAPTSSTLTVSSSNDPNYSYTWSPSTFLDVSTGSTVVSTPSTTTTYTVTGTDGNTGCVAQAVVTVNVGTTPTISGVTASPSSVCLGTPSQLQVTALASGSIAPEPSGYCAPVVLTSPGQTGDFISNVTFNTLNNSSGDDIDDYEYFAPTGSATTTVTAGATYALTVTTDPAFGQGKGVFIDWNRDGLFDASEAVMLSASGTTPVTLNVTVPISASQGLTRMRVVCWYANAATLAISCSSGSIGFGETEDYTITILSGGSLNYSWDNGGTLNSTTIANPIATPTSTTTYNVVVSDAAGCSTSSAVPVNVVLPPAAPIVNDATICGQGIANLTATGSGGTLIWLDTIAGPILATGGAYSPYVTSTQTYYVIEDQGATNFNVGLSATAAGTLAFASSTANYQTFNVLNPGGIIIRSVDIVPNAGTPLGTAVAIQLEDLNGNALGSPVTTVTTTQGLPQTITLDMFVPQGTGYRLRPVSNPNLQYHQSGFSNPYTLPGMVSITGWGPPNAATLYVFFYNWTVSVFDGTTGCFSVPSIATATVTPAPALSITPSGPTSWCNTGSVSLDAASASDPSWTNFSWSPATGLSSTTTAVVTANPSATTTYVLTATGGSCIDTASVTITVNSGPTVSIAPAPFDSLCNGTVFNINATSGSSSVKSLGTGNNSANNTIAVYDGNNANVKTQILYTAAELNAAGLFGPGNITSIAFNVVNKLSTGTLNGFSIGMANVAATTLTTTYATATFTNVFSGSVSTVLGWNTHTFSAPFFWDGTSNVLVEICNGVPTVPAFDQIQNTPTATTMTIQANLLGCTATTGNAILNRPNVRFTGGVVNYSWSPAGELSAANIEDPVYTASSTGAKALTLTVTDPANLCTASATINFVVSDVPKVASVEAISSTDVCFSGTVSMRAFGSAASLQWQSSADGVNFTDLVGETNDTLTQAVSADIWYRVKAFCVDSVFSTSLFFDVTAPTLSSVEGDTVCGQGVATLIATPSSGFYSVWFDAANGGNMLQNGDTLPVFVTATDTFWVAAAVAPLPVGGSAPTGYPANGGTSTIDEDIDGVTIGSLVNNQPAGGCATYTDYTSLPAPFLPLGSSVPFSVSIGDCEGTGFFSSGTSIFVDFNRDGDFGDAGEQVFTTTITTNGPHVLTGSFTVPMSSSLGLTRVRVINVEGVASPVYNQVYTYGETEDYLVNLGPYICQGPRTPVVAVVNPAPALEVTPGTASICDGSSVTLNVTTGAGDYTTFNWTPVDGLNTTTGTSVVASPATTTTYVVSASGNVNGCQSSDTIVVTVNPLPVFSLSTTTPNLCGGDTASISVTVTSPVSTSYAVTAVPYSPTAISGANGPSGDDATASAPIGFSFTFYGNTYTDVYISTNGFLSFDAGAGAGCCAGQVLPNAGIPNNLISLGWDDLIATAGQITYATVGTAPNRVFVVDYNAVPHLSGTGTPLTGQIKLFEGTNVVETHITSFSADGSTTTQGIENSTGTEGTSVPGRNGTTAWTATNDAYRFELPPTASLQWFGQNIIGSSTSADLQAVPTSSGYYTVVVTNPATGCTKADSIFINAGVNPQPVIVTNDTTLCAPNQIFVKVADAGPFSGGYPAGTTFAWYDATGGIIVPATPDLDTISSTNSSSFYVVVTLPSFCNATSDTAYIVTKAVSVVPTINNATCSAGGSILATVTSGTAPFQYIWSTDPAQTNVIQTTNTASATDLLANLAAGTYYLSVSDEFGLPGSCNSGVISFTVGGASQIDITVDAQTNVTCNGQADGSVSVSYTGGASPYSVLWSNGQTTTALAGLLAGTYTVTVSDLSGCADTLQVVITEPLPISVTLSSTPESAPGANDGTATAAVSGGTPGYTIDWYDLLANFLTSGTTATGLTGGYYQTLVMDNNGCYEIDTVEVTTITNVTLNLSMLIEGMYDGAGGLVPALLNSGVGVSTTECDTIHVEVRDQLSPLTVLASGTAVLNTSGQASFTFPGSVNGATGYIAVFHRNAVQTWSDLVTFSSTTNYNFTTAATQAFGGNQIEVAPGVWAFYSGDIAPQDEVVDITDQGQVGNDIFNFVSGYSSTDVSGDGVVDITDQSIVDNNIFNFISSFHP